MKILLNPDVLSGQQIGIMGNTGADIESIFISVFFMMKTMMAQWAFSEVVDPFGWEGSDEDPWVTANGPASRRLWRYPNPNRDQIGVTGNTISTPNGNARVTIPPGSLTETVSVELFGLPSLKRISSNFRSLGKSIWLRVLEWISPNNMKEYTSNGINNFSQPVTISFFYPDILSPTFK